MPHPDQQAGDDRQREATPSTRKCPGPLMWSTIQGKFWPKNPVRNVSGRKKVATIVSTFMISLSRLETAAT